MIGREYSIVVSKSCHFIDGTIWYDTQRKPGTAYNYGIGKPHYPVPALRAKEMFVCLNKPPCPLFDPRSIRCANPDCCFAI